MSEKQSKLLPEHEGVREYILLLRGQKVLLDHDLAGLYGVSTKRLNEQVKRNRGRFPEDFMFRLTAEEKEQVVANCDHLKMLKYSPVLPLAFTEHGALMAANILNSKKAVKMSIYVIRAFVRLREVFNLNQILQGRLTEIERILLNHDTALRDIYEKIRPLLLPPAKTDAVGFTVKGPRPGKIS